MRPTLLEHLAAAALLALPVPNLSAQQSPATGTPTIVADLMADVEQVRGKLEGLAEAIPESTWDWRPGEGVRSVTEVFLHVAADNYLLAVPLGAPAPASTGIDAADYGTVQAYEARTVTKAEALAELRQSFDHLRDAMAAVDAQRLAGTVQIFGSEFTGQAFLVLTATHLHEHLGQMIAYGRMNGVVPPWSGGQEQD
jgi:uncharacterized damage-inducible protein DinB